MSAWNKLQKSLYNIVTDKVNFQIHCSVYRMSSQRGNTDLPRYWITVDKQIIFDYPKQFSDQAELKGYPYQTQIQDISNIIREYLDCPVSLLLQNEFKSDLWGITDIFKAVDKRLGKEKLKKHFSADSGIILQLLKKRFGSGLNDL